VELQSVHRTCSIALLPNPGSPLRHPTRKEREILIVEDEASHAALICRAFTAQAGLVCLTVARTLQEAHTHLATSNPDLVIADYRLPDGNALELLPLNEEDRPYPVIILTAHASEQVEAAVLKAGALTYAVKSAPMLATLADFVEQAIVTWERHGVHPQIAAHPAAPVEGNVAGSRKNFTRWDALSEKPSRQILLDFSYPEPS